MTGTSYEVSMSRSPVFVLFSSIISKYEAHRKLVARYSTEKVFLSFTQRKRSFYLLPSISPLLLR